MAKILIKKSGNLEKELELAAPGFDGVSVGRDGANDLVLLDASVSRRHARIERKGDGYRIVDLESGNGILHRGQRVPSLDLYPGCEVEIGAYTIAYQSDEDRLAKLVLIGGGEQRAHTLSKGETLVGRSAQAHITVDEPLVSGSHFKILKRGSVWVLVDMESENGTLVNGVRVTDTVLEGGEQIQIAGLTFLFATDGVVPEPGSVSIIQATQTPPRESSVPAPEAPGPNVAPAAGPTPSPAKTSRGRLSSMPRLALIGSGLFVFLLFIIALILMRSPDNRAEQEFQDVFQSELSAEERERIGEYLSQAAQNEETGNLRLALEQYQKILVLDERHQEAQAESARLEEALEREAEARAETERDERERLARVSEIAEQADELLASRKFAEARKLLEEAKALVPESEVMAGKLVSSYVAEGDYFRRRNIERARRAYRQALELDPDSSEATRGLGRIDAGRRAAQERQRQVSEHTEQGLAALKREEYREASRSFSEVLKLDPENARAQEFREQAQELLEQKVRPMYEEGVRLYEADELAAAMAQFQRVLELHPDHGDTQSFLARATQKVRSVALDRYKRAYIFEGLGRFPEALELYRETLALLPDSREEYHQKASARIEELEKRR